MDTVGEARVWLKKSLNELFAADELPEIVWLVLSFYTGLSLAQILAFPEKKISSQQKEMLLLSVQKLLTGMPVQYVLGEADFFGLKFLVDPSVLIPRPETEELVAWILEEKDKSGDEQNVTLNSQPKSILDIGTGSGCIPISLKNNWQQLLVFGLDIAQNALQTAAQNAALNNVDISFFYADILHPTTIPDKIKFDILVSNPPYIKTSEQVAMHKNVLDFEPHRALFVTDDDPLIFYRAVVDFASFMLVKNGLLFFEINENLSAETIRLLADNGFSSIQLRHDFRGKPRMIRAVK